MGLRAQLGDIVVTKKPHPCGCHEWTVVRVGADYKIKCNNCGHIVMLDSEKFAKIAVIKEKNEQN